MKGNVINLNTLHLNSVRLNGIGKVQSVSLKGGSTEDPVFPPVEPPVEPEPTPTYTLSASVTNGKVSAKRNGSAVNLPFTANEGDVIVLEVAPNDGYEFNGWNDGNTDNPRSITMTADVVLSAQCVEVVQPPVGNYIQFEDKAVEAICVANWSSDGIGLTEEDAAKVTTIGTTFKGNTEITSFNELAYFTNVKIIGEYAFRGCSQLTSISLENVIAIEAYAFGESGLGGIISTPNLSGNLKTGAFYKTNVEEVADLGTVTRIANYTTTSGGVFTYCTQLKKVTLPSTLEQIDGYTFYGCSALATVICKATTPPIIANTVFNNTPIATGKGFIYVPDGSLEAYKTAVNWSAYADRIHPLSEIEGSPYIQFEDAEAERVLMANGVSSDGIGITKEDAANVTSIGTWFYNNTSIMSFNEFGNFTSITALNDNAFRGASNLQFLTIPPNVASIGWRALGYCSNLNTLVILKSASVIPALSNTLEGMKVSNAIYVADSLVESYKTAAYWSAFADKIKPLSEYNG